MGGTILSPTPEMWHLSLLSLMHLALLTLPPEIRKLINHCTSKEGMQTHLVTDLKQHSPLDFTL